MITIITITLINGFQGTSGLSLFYLETRLPDGRFNNLEIQVYYSAANVNIFIAIMLYYTLPEVKR